MASALITPPGISSNRNAANNLPPSATSSAKRRAKRHLSRMASGIGPAIPLSSLLLDECGGQGNSCNSSIECINLHSNELRTLTLVMDDDRSYRDRDGKQAGKSKFKSPPPPPPGTFTLFNNLLELDVSSNNLGKGYSNYYRSTIAQSDSAGGGAGVSAGRSTFDRPSLLKLTPNLRILNLSANGLKSHSLSLLLGLEGCRDQQKIVLQHLSTLDLSHNLLSELPAGLSAACPNLQYLNLIGNVISSSLPALIESLYPLRSSLSALYVNDGGNQSKGDGTNPVCTTKGYRERLICALEALGELDGARISDNDRDEARKAVNLGLYDSDSSGQRGELHSKGRDTSHLKPTICSSNISRTGQFTADTALSRRRKDETISRSVPSASNASNSISNGNMFASDETLQKLSKLENKVKLLTNMAQTQADATERLLRSNAAALRDGGDINAQGGHGESPHVRPTVSSELRKRGRGRNEAMQVTRVSEVAVQTQAVRPRQNTSDRKGATCTALKMAGAKQMASLLRQGQSRELVSAFTSLKLHAIMSRYAEEVNSIHGSSAQAVERRMGEEREMFVAREANFQSTIRELREAVEDYRHGIMVAEDRLLKAEDDKEVLRERHTNEMDRLRDDLEQEVEEVRDYCYDDQHRQSVRLQELEDQLIAARKENDDAHGQLATTLVELERAREKLNQAEQRCEAIVQETTRAIETVKNDAMKACDEELRSARKQSQSKMRQMKKVFEKAANRAARDRASLEEADRTIEALRAEVSALKKEVNGRDSADSDAKRALQSANATKRELEASLERKTRECEELDDEAKRLRRALSNRDSELDLVSIKSAELQKQLLEMEKAANEAVEAAQERTQKDKSHLAKVKARNERLKQEIYAFEQTQMEVDRLEALLGQREDGMKKCEEELLAVKDAFDKKVSKLIGRHEAEIEDAKASHRNEISSLKETIEHLKKSRGKAERKKQLAADDARDLSMVLQEERSARAAAEERVTQLEAALRNQKDKAKIAIEGLCRDLVPRTPKGK